MSVYASVQFFDLCRCSVSEIAEYLSLHEWEVRLMLKDPPKPKPQPEILWRASDWKAA